MYTRKQRLADECTHDEYWAQLVKPCITDMVLRRFGISRLEDSTDPHMNDIPLHQWDALHETTRSFVASNTGGILDTLRAIDGSQAKLALEGKFSWSQSDSVCVLKRAAKMFIKQEVVADTDFRVFPEGDVIALFLNIPERKGCVFSYQHVGQHGTASLGLLSTLPAATREQYKSLAYELHLKGYVVIPSGPYEDGEVLGVDADGYVLQWHTEKQSPYNSGESVKDFGRKNMRRHEWARIRKED